MEAFFSNFKTENRQFFQEAEDKEDLKRRITKAISYYNKKRIHSKSEGLPPLKYLRSLIFKKKKMIKNSLKIKKIQSIKKAERVSKFRVHPR